MIKVGLIGESPHDTDAIINLLSLSYKNRFKFVKLLERVTGSNLESLGKMKSLLLAEVKTRQDISLIIFIRDLDALEGNKQALNERKKWFNYLQSIVEIKSIFLLNIFELEALILSDIENFNKAFGTQIKFRGNPMLRTHPKEFLVQQTRNNRKQFQESDNPQLFKKLKLDTIKSRCRYFNEFIADLEAFNK